jgi:dUTP pyrophosphatase
MNFEVGWLDAKRLSDPTFFVIKRRQMQTIHFKKLDPLAQIPKYMTPQSAGMDLCIILDKDIIISPGQLVILGTGLALAMPNNMEAQIRPRSGLSLKYPNYIANSPGTIDSDYRGEIKIPFINNINRTAVFTNGERIAQIIFSRVVHVDITETDTLTNTLRSAGGFGHTGT